MENDFSFSDLVSRVGLEKALKAVAGRRIDPGQRISEEDMERFSRSIEELLTSPPSVKDTTESGRIYVIKFFDPLNNVEYLTIMQNGQIEATKRPDGHGIDKEAFEREGLVCYRSMDEIFADIFSASPGPFEEPREKKQAPEKEEPKKPRKKTGPRMPKPPVTYMVDPKLRDYLQNKVDFLTWAVFKKTGDRQSTKIHSPADLEQLGLPENFFENARKSGLEVSVQETVGFVFGHRGEIKKARDKRLKELSNRPEIIGVIRNYLEGVERQEGGFEGMLRYLQIGSNARNAYQFFQSATQELEDVRPIDAIDALRHSAYRMFESDKKTRSRAVRSLGAWVAVAKAMDFVTEDKFLHANVEPLFKKAKNVTPEETGEAIYDAMRVLLGRLTRQELHYSTDELDFIIKGFWYHGYFQKEKRNETKEQGVVSREIRGVNTQFISPAVHLMRRYQAYDRKLNDAFECLLLSGDITKETKLESHSDDSKFAERLYNAIPQEERDRIFTHLRTQKPLQGMGPTHEGQQIRWVLEYYVGVNREKFASAIRDFYTED